MVFRPPPSLSPTHPRPIRDEDARATLWELLGVHDPPVAVAWAAEGESKSEGLVARRVRFANMLGEEVAGVLIVPAAAATGGLPAAVCTPGNQPRRGPQRRGAVPL